MKTPKRFSKRRLIENEKLIRDNNVAAKEAIAKYFSADKNARTDLVAFYCECSRLSCGAQIPLSIQDYERQHEREDRFTIMDGHQMPELEKIVSRHPHYIVVEKYDIPARQRQEATS